VGNSEILVSKINRFKTV